MAHLKLSALCSSAPEMRRAAGSERLDDEPSVSHLMGMAKQTAASVGGILRGVKLVKKAIEAGRSDTLSEPEPVAAAVLKKLVLPNGEPISPAMKELLKVDSLWLGMEYDEDEGDIEAVSFEDFVEDHFGAEAAHLFAEASELLGGECIAIGGASEAARLLYVGEADESGEYAVITVRKEPTPWVGGFVPFDVWVAQELGALESAKEPGAVPAQYEAAAKALADANGDGRLGFVPVAGEASEDEEDEEDEEDAGEEGDDASESDDAVTAEDGEEDEDEDEEQDADEGSA
jgi:hypothetical protein